MKILRWEEERTYGYGACRNETPHFSFVFELSNSNNGRVKDKERSMKCPTSKAQTQAGFSSSSCFKSRRTSRRDYVVMAQVTGQRGLKLLFSSFNVPFPFDSKSSCGGAAGLRLEEHTHFRKNKMIRMSSRGKTPHSPAHDEANNDDDYDGQYDDLSYYRGLVLDISYRPVNVVCWKRAICLEFMDKADVLEYYDQTVNSANGSFFIPAVLRIPDLLQVVKRRRFKQHLSRKNIFFRDDFKCQYCSSAEMLTIDHVLPVSQGGEWQWDNLVTACTKCNSRKGDKTLEEAKMKLIKVPKTPKDFDILAMPLTTDSMRILRKRKGLPHEWDQYLGKLPSDGGKRGFLQKTPIPVRVEYPRTQ